MVRIAIIDDYQNVVLDMADWDSLGSEVTISVFSDHLSDEAELANRLKDFEVIVINRERTPFMRSLIEQLPNLKLLVTGGMYNKSIDMVAAKENNVIVCGSRMLTNPTPELTWGLILSLARQIPAEDRGVREGGWQTTVGIGLKGSVLGVIGLGRLGVPVSKIGLAFGMEVIAWSPNLTDQRAQEAGVKRVDKETLFEQSDFITIHMPLSERSQSIVGKGDLARMKKSAYLVNTSRGPLVDEAALIDALEKQQIAGAGLDVYVTEPLPADHKLRQLKNTVVTPHLGYVVKDNYQQKFSQAIENIDAWMKGDPIRVIPTD